MITLGIESTAHTASLGIINDKGKILADARDMYKTEREGLIPLELAKHHKEVFPELLKEVLNKVDVKDIDIISFSQGPGLSPCLLEGMKFSKELSEKFKIPLVPVNHLIAHLEIGKLFTKAKDPVFILATGANTQIIFFEGNRYHISGETLDIGIGNALDKFGRNIGLGFPAGPKIEELAKKGKYIELPYTVKGQDLVFAGLITETVNKFKKGVKKEDLCCSLQETAFAMLCEVSERAMAHCGKKEALLIGGVAANKRLMEMLNIMCKERNAKFYAVPLKYSGDNAVMIGWQGILQYKSNKRYYDSLKLKDIDIKPGWRADEVIVNWS